MATRYEKPFAQKPLVQNLLGKKFEAISDASDTSFLGLIKAMIPSFLTSYLGNYNSEIARRKDAAIQEVRDNFLDAQDAVQEQLTNNEPFRKEFGLYTLDRKNWERQTGDKIWEASPEYDMWRQKQAAGFDISGEYQAKKNYIDRNIGAEVLRLEGYKDNQYISKSQSYFTKNNRQDMIAAIKRINADPQYRGALFNIASKIGDAFEKNGMPKEDAQREAGNLTQQAESEIKIETQTEERDKNLNALGVNDEPIKEPNIQDLVNYNKDRTGMGISLDLNTTYFSNTGADQAKATTTVLKQFSANFVEGNKLSDEARENKKNILVKGTQKYESFNPLEAFETDGDYTVKFVNQDGEEIKPGNAKEFLSSHIARVVGGNSKRLDTLGRSISGELALDTYLNMAARHETIKLDGNQVEITIPSKLYMTREEIRNLDISKGAQSAVFDYILGNTERNNGGVMTLPQVRLMIRESEKDYYLLQGNKFLAANEIDKGQAFLAKVEEMDNRTAEEESAANIKFILDIYNAKDIEGIPVSVDGTATNIKPLSELTRTPDYVNKLYAAHAEKYGKDSALEQAIANHFNSIEIDSENIKNLERKVNPEFVQENYKLTNSNYIANITAPETKADIDEALSTLSIDELAGLAKMSDKEIFERLGIPDFSYTKYSDIRNILAGVLRVSGTGAGIAAFFTGPIAGTASAGLFGAAELVEPNTFSDFINDRLNNRVQFAGEFNNEERNKVRRIGMTVFTGQDRFKYAGDRVKPEEIPQEFFKDLQVALGLIGEPSETARLFAEDTALKESL